MASVQIANPRGASGYTPTSGRTTDPFKANTNIGRRKAAAFQGPTGTLVSLAGVSVNPKLFAGIALEAAAAGDTVQLVTHGVIDMVPVDGAVAPGDGLKPGTTAGSLIGGAAAGDVVAIALSVGSGGFATVKVMV